MKDQTKFAVGTGVGVAADVAWRCWPEHTQFYMKLQEEKHPLAFVEHYHYALAAFIGGRLSKTYGKVFDGFGTIMVMTEAFQEQPFGIGKEEWQVEGNVLLSTLLGSVLALSWAFKK